MHSLFISFSKLEYSIEFLSSSREVIKFLNQYFITKKSANYVKWKITLYPVNKKQYEINFSQRRANYFYPLDDSHAFIKILIAFIGHLICLDGMYLIHGSSIINGEKLIVFSGEQGVGKSTISQMSGYKIFSDDLVCVIIAKSKYYAITTPFEKLLMYQRQSIIPINKLYFLNHNKINFISIISDENKIIKMTMSLFSRYCKMNNPLLSKIKFRFILNFIFEIPIFNLNFNKDKRFLSKLLSQDENISKKNPRDK